ncbi:hypothetical protein MAPG_02464 [Magnaporthiopsis poae ATCC 64411]|uniref:Uncharacterized protein n=1 Tax=Magnaporthiopsis poae (strain ATCC 64411 / 73-15) TaxID=644358 RepID=A0A0C4DRF7_MAGP6|nr:hypothetical protein MAPG_02464 [Magnaporthiopsis poae ATCC 64411]
MTALQLQSLPERPAQRRRVQSRNRHRLIAHCQGMDWKAGLKGCRDVSSHKLTRAHTVPSLKRPAIASIEIRRRTNCTASDASASSPDATSPDTCVARDTGGAPLRKDDGGGGFRSTWQTTDGGMPQEIARFCGSKPVRTSTTNTTFRRRSGLRLTLDPGTPGRRPYPPAP